MKAKISEIFKSIQGEGLYQGVEQVFVRFFGCNLACDYCDTKISTFEELTVAQVMEKIGEQKPYYSVSLTGGEPLLQIDFLLKLAKALKDFGAMLYLETNGVLTAHLKRIIHEVDVISMDFKLPSSTGQKPFWKEHRDFLAVAVKKNVFIKAVIGEKTTSEDIAESITIIKQSGANVPLVLQPMYPFEALLKEKLEIFQKTCQTAGINATIIGQLHKQLGIR